MLRRSRQHGVTIIEIVIGLASIALLLAMGLPSYSTWLANTQIRNAASAALNGLQLARNEAVRRNTNVEFAFNTASGWTVAVPGGDTIQTRSANDGSGRVTIEATDGKKVTFNSIGRVTANADLTPAITQLEFAVPGATEDTSRKLHIVVAATGNVRLCDTNQRLADDDPRKCSLP